jgi:ankyrin repeat protein
MKKISIMLLAFFITLACKAQEHTVFTASKIGDLNALIKFKESGADFNQTDSRGFTPLILAVYNNQTEATKYLIANGADVNKGDKSGNTALMGAIFKGYNDLVKVLIDAKANVNQVNLNGASALIFAATFGRIDVVHLLLKHKADKNLKDARGKTAYDHAVMQEHEALIRVLKP